MQGVTFDTKHSYRAWGLMFASRPVISPPKPKLKLIQVPGTDKVIDLTETLTGQVHYEPRTIKMEFVLMEDKPRWDAIYSEILETVHGKKVQIIFDDDLNYFYVGRVVVGDMKGEKAMAKLEMTAEVEPYKHERHGEGRRL